MRGGQAGTCHPRVDDPRKKLGLVQRVIAPEFGTGPPQTACKASTSAPRPRRSVSTTRRMPSCSWAARAAGTRGPASWWSRRALKTRVRSCWRPWVHVLDRTWPCPHLASSTSSKVEAVAPTLLAPGARRNCPGPSHPYAFPLSSSSRSAGSRRSAPARVPGGACIFRCALRVGLTCDSRQALIQRARGTLQLRLSSFCRSARGSRLSGQPCSENRSQDGFLLPLLVGAAGLFRRRSRSTPKSESFSKSCALVMDRRSYKYPLAF